MELPTHTRLVAGTRLLNPFTGTYHKYGGRFVHVQGWTEDGRVVVRMKMFIPGEEFIRGGASYLIFFHVSAESIGLCSPVFPTQEKLDLTFMFPTTMVGEIK